MITELRADDPKRSCVLHWDKVKWLQGRKNIEFKPGLNILWGPNGSGKSTVLTALARMLHCEQGGRTVVTRDSFSAVFNIPDSKNPKAGKRVDTLADGIYPVHDGQCAMHFDPGHAVGLIGGGAGFDYDFMDAGVMNTMFRGSAGETVMSRIDKVLGAIVKLDENFPKIEWKVSQDSDKARMIAKFLEGTLPEKGQPTVLLDEPDRSLSLKVQAGLWRNLAMRFAKNVQIIAASHSPLALHLPGANYIETEPGYLAECERVIDLFIFDQFHRAKETPK